MLSLDLVDSWQEVLQRHSSDVMPGMDVWALNVLSEHMDTAVRQMYAEGDVACISKF